MESGYRCFLYDAATIIAARLELENNPKARQDLDIGTNDNQLAIETALNKIRSLFDFFGKNSCGDDLSCKDFDFGLKSLSSDQYDIRTAIHKYSMHLTWERVSRQKTALPRINKIIERSRELDKWIKEFISHCKSQKLNPDGPLGPKYLNFINNNIS